MALPSEEMQNNGGLPPGQPQQPVWMRHQNMNREGKPTGGALSPPHTPVDAARAQQHGAPQPPLPRLPPASGAPFIYTGASCATQRCLFRAPVVSAR